MIMINFLTIYGARIFFIEFYLCNFYAVRNVFILRYFLTIYGVKVFICIFVITHKRTVSNNSNTHVFILFVWIMINTLVKMLFEMLVHQNTSIFCQVYAIYVKFMPLYTKTCLFKKWLVMFWQVPSVKQKLLNLAKTCWHILAENWVKMLVHW